MTRPPIHPGEILADKLAEFDMGAAELGRVLHVPTKRVAKILGARRAMTADTALRLGHCQGAGPKLWMDLQKIYQLRLAEQESGSEARRTTVPRSA